MSDFKTGVYRHYKNKLYLLVDVARHSETLEEYAVYFTLYGERKMWIRPKDMFFGQIEVDGISVPRFEYIGDMKV